MVILLNHLNIILVEVENCWNLFYDYYPIIYNKEELKVNLFNFETKMNVLGLKFLIKKLLVIDYLYRKKKKIVVILD